MNLSLEDLVTFRSISIVLILYTGVNGFGPKSVRRAPNQWFERIMWINVFKNQKFQKMITRNYDALPTVNKVPYLLL